MPTLPTLTVTEEGQVSLQTEVLEHLGVHGGEKIQLDLLPGGGATLRAAVPASQSTERTGGLPGFSGCLAGKTTKIATLEEIEEAIQMGWAGLVK